MKTLLMLLLFTSVSFTQDNVNLVARVKDQRNKECFEKYDLIFANIYNGSQSKETHLVTLSSIVKLWEDYQKECYADSTLDKYRTWITETTEDTLKTNKYYREHPNEQRWMVFTNKRNIYSHKQPTFEGFMAYLKRKLGDHQ